MSALNKLLMKEKQQAYTLAHPPTAKDPRQLHSDWRYVAALEQLQMGSWRQAGSLLRILQTEYPAASALTQLFDEAQFKAEIETVWAGKIIGRRPRRIPRRLVSLVAYLLVVTCLLLGGSFFYRKMQSVDGQTAQQQVLLAEAQTALGADQVQVAADLFRQLLILNPSHLSAQRGYANAAMQLELAHQYAAGEQALQTKDFAQALTYLTFVQQQAPNYRDVERLLAQVQAMQAFEELFAAAEAAYQAQTWSDAVQAYEALRQINSTYAATVVEPRLAAAYLNAGQEIVAQRPGVAADLLRAEEYLSKATRLGGDTTLAEQAYGQLTTYLAGTRALQEGDSATAVALLEAIYQAAPGYLGGELAEQLYTGYLTLGARATEQGDLTGALALYNKAAALAIRDNSEAVQQAQTLSATPIAAPEPEVAVQMEAVAPVYAAPPPPTATPVPAPASLATLQGWIAFRTNRDGDVAIYVMQPDGSQQQRAPEDAATLLDQLYAQQQWSADGTTLLYVANAPDRADSNLFTVRADLPITATRDVMLTDFNGSEYDPVWSPSGAAIAFVANHTGNDEIWTMNGAGGTPVQLTVNEWQWDKHPTWSPDGGQLAFFSNRTGLRQIWVMNADGTNQHNISNNSSEDWDPVWIR